MGLVAGLNRCCKSEARCSDCQEGFLSGERAARYLVPGVGLLSPGDLSGPNVSSPISSNGQGCNAQTFQHFFVLHMVFLLPLGCISTKTLVGTLGHSSLSIPRAGVVTDCQEQGGGEW